MNSIELILNAALSAACLLPHWKVRAYGEGEKGGGAKQGEYNSIKLPSGPASHWLTFALTFALSVIARAAALCLFGDLCCPARGLPLPHSPTRLRTENCLLPLLCLWCHNKRIMLPLVECESLPLVCQLPFVFAFFVCLFYCLFASLFSFLQLLLCCCLTIKMPCPPRGAGEAHQVYLLRAQTKLQKNCSCNELLIYLNSFYSVCSPRARPNDISLKRHQASNDIYADCISMSSCSTSIRKSYWRGQFNMASTDWREVFESESESESRKLRLGWSFIQAAME